MRVRRLFDLGLCGLFVGAIASILATTTWTGGAPWVVAYENRSPVSWPSPPARWNAVSGYLEQVGAFFDDRFGLRRVLIDLRGRIEIGLFNRSPSPQVVAGRRGFMFYTGDRSMDDFLHREMFSPAEVAAWVAILRARETWFASRGIHYLFVLAPNKQTIYPELLPAWVRPQPGLTRREQLDLALTGDPQFLDLAPSLLAAKPKGQLYWKTDTHWSSLGAQIGFQAIMQRLGMLPDARVGAEEPTFESNDIRDLARMAGVSVTERGAFRAPACGRPDPMSTSAAIYGPGLPPNSIVSTTCPMATERLLMFQDSFSVALSPFLSDSFGRVAYVWRMPTGAMIAAAVDQEKPTVVIEERVERFLSVPLAN